MEITTYLKQLKFDPKLLNGLFAHYLQNTRLVVLIVLLVVIVGIVSYLNLPRVLNPEIKIPIVITAKNTIANSNQFFKTISSGICC